MTPPPIQKSGQIVRHALPLATAVLFILSSVIVLPVPYLSGITPMLGLMAVYYWSIYRPDLLRPVLVFMVGLLNDVVHLLPIGLSSVLFLAVYQLVFSQRRFFVGQIFYVVWTGFALVAFLASVAQWIVVSFFENQVLSLQPVAIQLAMTIMVFPLPAWLLIWLQRTFLMQDR